MPVKHIDQPAIAALLAFGAASVAATRVYDLVGDDQLTDEAAGLLAELQVTQARLRRSFACGQDEAVTILGRDIRELADRTIDAIERSKSRPDC